MSDVDVLLVIVNSSFGVSLVLVMTVSFQLPVSSDRTGKTKTKKSITLSSLHQEYTRDQGRILKSRMDGDEAFLFDQVH
jgi:hypothetical protein